jgi:hypothetical protein
VFSEKCVLLPLRIANDASRLEVWQREYEGGPVMDTEHMDAIARRLGAATRRTLLGIGTGAGLAALLATDNVDAKKKRKKKKNKKKKCPVGTKLCVKTCISTDTCCTDADCPAGKGQTCQAGTCKCPPGQGNSQGVCGTPPLCIEPQLPCDEGTCCSGVCTPDGGPGVCALGAAGTPCIRTDYCEGGLECIGFICRPA